MDGSGMDGSAWVRHFITGVTVALLVTVAGWFLMPAGEIPVHFGGGGQADGWGTRTELTLVMGVTVLGLAALMAALVWWARSMPWGFVNIPHNDREFWQRPENDAQGRARIREDMALVGAWTMWLMVAVQVCVVWSVRIGEITPWLGAALIGVPVLLTGWLLVVMLKRSGFYHQHPDEG